MHLCAVRSSLLASVALLLSACGGSSSVSDARPNVLLLSLDTVRVDRLGCYGHAAARTPNLDALAARGVRFERAYAPVPFTLPSHATLLTGVNPDAHGLHANHQGMLPKEVTTLAETFARQGYHTSAFVATGVLDPRFGLARGFETYDSLAGRPLSAGGQTERPGNEVTQAATKWLESHTAAPFFAWVHYYDAHDPYAPPEGFRDLADPYDGEIAYVDAQVGALLATLTRLGELDNTYVVVVADHGEAFGEHGEHGHGLLVYDTTMRVPMIVAGPAPIARGATVAEPVGLVDVHPTLAALLGFETPKGTEGRSVVPALRGEPLTTAPLRLESEYPLRGFGWAPLHALVAGPWKYIHAPQDELFHVPDDPGELQDVAASRTDVRDDLGRTLAQLRSSAVRRTAGAVHLGADTRDALSKLGYAEGSEVAVPQSLAGLKDPKAMTAVANETVHARACLRVKDFARALATVAPLLEQSPESDELWALQGHAQLGLGKNAEALASFERSLRDAPDNPERVRLAGDALLALGRNEEALARFRLALELDPLDGQSHGRLAMYLARNGKADEAVKHFERFAELDPTSPNAHTNLANGLFAVSRFDEGIAHLRKALELDPQCSPAHRSLYIVHRRLGHRQPAIQALRDALAALPRETFFRARLAWELATTQAAGDGAGAEAVTLARACLQADPNAPDLLDLLGVALARQGDFTAAIEAAGAALSEARSRNRAELVAPIEKRLELYERKQAYFE